MFLRGSFCFGSKVSILNNTSCTITKDHKNSIISNILEQSAAKNWLLLIVKGIGTQYVDQFKIKPIL